MTGENFLSVYSVFCARHNAALETGSHLALRVIARACYAGCANEKLRETLRIDFLLKIL